MPKDFISIEEAYKTILNGGVGVLPTDTLYGLVAKANNADAVSRLYALKDRENKPGTVIAQNIDQLVELGLKRRYLRAVNKYWPGPVSVIIPTGPNLSYLHQGKFSLAVRIPNDPNLTKLLSVTGPLLTTSANAPGKPPATNIDEAKQYFGNKVDFYVDGGPNNGQPSTVIRVVDDVIEILRQGKTRINEQTGEVIDHDI